MISCAVRFIKRKGGKLLNPLAAVGLAVGLIFPAVGLGQTSTEAGIRAKIDHFVQGLQQENMDKVVGIFKPDAVWLERDIHKQVQVSAAAMFEIWDHIQVRVDDFNVTPKEKYMTSRVMLNLKAQIKSDGSPVEKNVDLRWVWENTPDGWLVVADQSKPGPVVSQSPPPPLTDTDRQGAMPISIEVVGFGIKPGSKEEKQLIEVAAKGGGGYLPAANSDELIDALKAAVEKTVRGGAPPSGPQESGWQSIVRGDSSNQESLEENDQKKRSVPKGHSTPYGF